MSQDNFRTDFAVSTVHKSGWVLLYPFCKDLWASYTSFIADKDPKGRLKTSVLHPSFMCTINLLFSPLPPRLPPILQTPRLFSSVKIDIWKCWNSSNLSIYQIRIQFLNSKTGGLFVILIQCILKIGKVS